MKTNKLFSLDRKALTCPVQNVPDLLLIGEVRYVLVFTRVSYCVNPIRRSEVILILTIGTVIVFKTDHYVKQRHPEAKQMGNNSSHFVWNMF